MNEDVKSENLRIHSRADELIACLEGEIAKRDARIVELEADLTGTQSRVLSLQNQWRKLDSELAAIKAQEPVGVIEYFEGQACVVGIDPEFSRLPEGTKLYAAPVSEAKAQGVVMLGRDAIREVFMSNGFTIKEGQADLKPYVYAAAEELLRLAAPAAPAADAGFSPDIQAMVSRFLGWRLPDNFHPDAGVVFTPPPNHHWWPTGTNLLSADQAKAMFEYVLAPSAKEHLDSIRNLKARIADLAERLPYADGQSYYDDKRKIEALTAELFQLEASHD